MLRYREFAFVVYAAARKAARLTGLAKPMRRLVGPAVGKLLFRTSFSPDRPAEVHDHQMFLAPPGRYPPLDMARNRYEPGTTRLFVSLLESNNVVIDVGAHVGYYSLLAARQIGPNGKVYAFEPENGNYELLKKNIALNGYSNVRAVNKAVSNHVGNSTLHLTALDNGRHSIYGHDLPESGTESVETTTLDVFLRAQWWPAVDLVKIDVEGAEMDVLNGMSQLLQQQHGVKLIIEFNPRLLKDAGVDLLQFLNKPASLGFTVQRIDEQDGLMPMESVDLPDLADKLLVGETSVNLYCFRL